MPNFAKLLRVEAVLKTATAKSTEHLKEYIHHISNLAEHEAVKIEASAGESLRAVSRRVRTAAKHTGKEVEVKRAGEEVYVWLKTKAKRKPGRPRKTPK